MCLPNPLFTLLKEKEPIIFSHDFLTLIRFKNKVLLYQNGKIWCLSVNYYNYIYVIIFIK